MKRFGYFVPYEVMMTSSNVSFFCVTGPIVRRIHRSPAKSPHKGQLMRTFVTLVFDQHIFFVVTVLCETFLMIKRNVSIIYATNISDPAVRGLLSIWIKCKFPTNEKRRYVRKVFCYWLRVFAAINRTHIQLYQGYGPKRLEMGALNNIYIYIYTCLIWYPIPCQKYMYMFSLQR